MTSVERKLDRIIELLTLLATAPFGPLPQPKAEKTPAPVIDPKARAEQSRKNHEAMMQRRRDARGSEDSDFPTSTIGDIETWRKGR